MMAKIRSLDQKGLALFMVLSVILLVVTLANVIISILLNQTRLTHHQVSRIQAFYAAQAAILNTFELFSSGTYHIDSCPSGCSITFNDSDLPHTIKSVSVIIRNPGTPDCPPGNSACISATVNYELGNF